VLLPNDHLPNLHPLEPKGQSCDGSSGPGCMCSGQELDVSAGSQGLPEPCSAGCGCSGKAAGVACLAHCETCKGEGDVIYQGDHWTAFDPACIKCERRVK
jgi:hypothetical protein